MYVVAVALYFGIHEIVVKVGGAQKEKIAKGSAAASALVLLLGLGLYFAGTALFALVAGCARGENQCSPFEWDLPSCSARSMSRASCSERGLAASASLSTSCVFMYSAWRWS